MAKTEFRRCDDCGTMKNCTLVEHPLMTEWLCGKCRAQNKLSNDLLSKMTNEKEINIHYLKVLYKESSIFQKEIRKAIKYAIEELEQQ